MFFGFRIGMAEKNNPVAGRILFLTGLFNQQPDAEILTLIHQHLTNNLFALNHLIFGNLA